MSQEELLHAQELHTCLPPEILQTWKEFLSMPLLAVHWKHILEGETKQGVGGMSLFKAAKSSKRLFLTNCSPATTGAKAFISAPSKTTFHPDRSDTVRLTPLSLYENVSRSGGKVRKTLTTSAGACSTTKAFARLMISSKSALPISKSLSWAFLKTPDLNKLTADS